MLLAQGLRADPADSSITVHADRVANSISPWMYGSCIEDVNHEIYGGLYAQLIFGESFEEPPPAHSPLAGWSIYGGNWTVHDGALWVEPDAGAKLIRDATNVYEGSFGCDVLIPDASGDRAGLILHVTEPHVGADNWIGYEVSLSAREQRVFLSRHHFDWLPLADAHAAVEPGKWHSLHVHVGGKHLLITLDNAVVISFTDPNPEIHGGHVGVRTWNSRAAFRNLTVSSVQGDAQESLGEPGPPDETAQVSGMWDPVQTGAAKAAYAWDGARPFNSAHDQKISHMGGAGSVGVVNRGLNRWGIAVSKGAVYSGRLYVRRDGGGKAAAHAASTGAAKAAAEPGSVVVALQSADGSRTYASQRLAAAGAAWSRRDFQLRSTGDDPTARFAILLDRPATVHVDQVTLTGTGSALFKGLAIRADIAQMLKKEGLTFMRYGGSMVNSPEYRWKKMIGDPDRRPQYRGTWYPYSTNGFGIEDFVRFCRAAGIEPAFAINIEETELDAADLVEYLNGPITSRWGKRRAANGHPEPYAVRYIEIGNEEAISGKPEEYAHYLERFRRLAPAMHAKDPRLHLVISAWWRHEEPWCRRIVEELRGQAALWDVHVGGDDLREGANVDRLLTDMRRLFEEWSPGTPMRACIFEENGDQHDLQRALGHAHILNVTQRHGDFVLMDCPANCLQPFGQNDNGWNQGQVFFTADQVWGMPPYYAQQMAAENHLPSRVESETTSPDSDLDVTATRSKDGKTLVIKVVNVGVSPHTASVRLEGSRVPAPHAEVWKLTGTLKSVNLPALPERVRSHRSQFDGAASQFEYTFPAHSYTILRLGLNKPGT
jgi:alpha-L-arabinofuranosidase